MFPAPRTSPALVFPRRPQHGEVLPLKTVTYAAVAVSLAALLAASALLALVRTLRSNLHSTHRHLAGALFCSQLVFVVGVAQTGNPVSPPAPCPPTPPYACVHGRRAGLPLRLAWRGLLFGVRWALCPAGSPSGAVCGSRVRKAGGSSHDTSHVPDQTQRFHQTVRPLVTAQGPRAVP